MSGERAGEECTNLGEIKKELVIHLICNIAAAAAGAAAFCMIAGYCSPGNGRGSRPLCTWIFRGTGGITALYCLHRYEEAGACLTMFGFFCILAAVTLTDLGRREIPDMYCAAVVILAFISAFTLPGLPVWERAAGSLCVSLPFLVVAVAVPGAFGGGDVKLMAACGLFLGVKITAVAAAAGILLAGCAGAGLVLSGRRGKRGVLALGPFLCAGMTAGVIWGEQMIQWYIS